MQITALLLFYISGFVIFWAMIGYPISIKLLGRIYSHKKIQKDYSFQPTVTVMVVAHNEEKVILDKLKNLIDLEYPEEKIEFLVSSDNSTDRTNQIVRKFIEQNPEKKIRLYETKERKGKTNAQNEAHKLITTEFMVMTDANSMLEKNAIKELMATFTSDNISYVCGRLKFINQNSTDISNAESSYWDSDITIREIESRIHSITAGNGALYACRTAEYYDFDPIFSHDTAMPIYFALQGKRAIVNHDAIAFEKASEVIGDEFKRKVRMNRLILKLILPNIKLLNIFKYKWFTYFYFGHRTCRYTLWIAHLLLFLSNLFLIMNSLFFKITFIFQLLFYFIATIKIFYKNNNKIVTLIYYYCVTVIAQWVGVYNIITGKTKPIWEKAESTR